MWVLVNLNFFYTTLCATCVVKGTIFCFCNQNEGKTVRIIFYFSLIFFLKGNCMLCLARGI